MARNTTTSRAVTTTGKSRLPAHIAKRKVLGRGVPRRQKDFLIPMAKVLDAKSPETEKRGASYIKGAEAGDIVIKNSPIGVIKGEAGFLFQPCYEETKIVEWLPRGGGGGGGQGFVGSHDEDWIEKNPKDAVKKPHPENPEKMIWVRKSTGNHLVETRYYYGYMMPEEGDRRPPMPLVLPFASTGHTPAKNWNMLMNMKMNDDGEVLDSYFVIYRVVTRIKQRGSQSWYLFDITDAGDLEDGLPTTLYATDAQIERGEQLHKALTTGRAKIDEDTLEDRSQAGDDDRM
jgi:hypothetical protein